MLKVNILFAVRRFHLKLLRTKSLVSYVEVVESWLQKFGAIWSYTESIELVIFPPYVCTHL